MGGRDLSAFLGPCSLKKIVANEQNVFYRVFDDC
jgi:hypothetical protein